MRDEVLKENPGMEDILNSVTERLNVNVICELNGRVDIGQEGLEDVAEEFLGEQGLIQAGL